MLSRTQPVRLALATGVAATALLAGGCIVSVGGSRTSYGSDSETYRVTDLEFEHVLGATRMLEVGMTRDEVVACYDPRLLAKFSTVRLTVEDEDAVVEEWRLRATRPGQYHERWLYFIDGELQAFNDDRFDAVDLSSLHTGWFSHGATEHHDHDHRHEHHGDGQQDHDATPDASGHDAHDHTGG